MEYAGKQFTRAQMHERVGHQHQMGGVRRYTLEDGKAAGLDAIDIDTGIFRCTVLPSRGLDISGASFKGLNIAYQTPVGEIHPAYYEPEGVQWLRTFTGGLLTTCGLSNFGPPCHDEATELDLGLHGRYSTLPAREVNARAYWEGDEYLIEVTGIVEEASLFGHKLRLTRTITSSVGSNGITIHDKAENFGFEKAPICLLYHINAGFPLLDEGGTLTVDAEEVSPRDDHSKAGLDNWSQFPAPQPHIQEQCYFHKVRADKNGFATALLRNERLNLGLEVSFAQDTLPWLTQWKNPGQGDYVMGIEPGTSTVADRNTLEKNGQLQYLAPGETRDFTVRIAVV